MGHGSFQLIWSGMESRNPGESDMSALSVRAAAAEAGDRPALIFGDLSWTWAQLAADDLGHHAASLGRVGQLGEQRLCRGR